MKRRSLIASLVVTVAVLAPAVPSGVAQGTAVAPLLLSGRVVDASGAPLAAAAVVAYTLPVDLNGLRPGDAIPEVEIGRTTSDSNGRFTLTVENTKSADGAITELVAGSETVRLRVAVKLEDENERETVH